MAKDGGPAFPSHGSMGEVAQQGMTLRDYFAAKAMQTLLLSDRSLHHVLLAKYSYAIADAMIEERTK